MLIEQALGEFSEVHRRVVMLRRLGGYTARDTAAEVNNHYGERVDTPMTEDNVHQIASRFDKRLRAIIEADEGQE
jgi:DNA-directed RNA polymerase specialized sigma24 family protein